MWSGLHAPDEVALTEDEGKRVSPSCIGAQLSAHSSQYISSRHQIRKCISICSRCRQRYNPGQIMWFWHLQEILYINCEQIWKAAAHVASKRAWNERFQSGLSWTNTNPWNHSLDGPWVPREQNIHGEIRYLLLWHLPLWSFLLQWIIKPIWRYARRSNHVPGYEQQPPPSNNQQDGGLHRL